MNDRYRFIKKSEYLIKMHFSLPFCYFIKHDGANHIFGPSYITSQLKPQGIFWLTDQRDTVPSIQK